jgi:hypothetical protein
MAGLAAAGVVALSTPAMAAFPPEINLSELDGSNGFTIYGIGERDASGSSVSAAGDVNDDGIDDVIIGAPDRAGESYVVFGRAEVPPNVNDHVTFEPDPSTFTSTPDTNGCPHGFVGKFGFEAQLTNISQTTLSDLQVEVAKLSNHNLLLTPDGTIGEGGLFPVPQENGYSDGALTPGEYVDVPFDICLKKKKAFRFFVDVLGVTE